MPPPPYRQPRCLLQLTSDGKKAKKVLENANVPGTCLRHGSPCSRDPRSVHGAETDKRKVRVVDFGRREMLKQAL